MGQIRTRMGATFAAAVRVLAPQLHSCGDAGQKSALVQPRPDIRASRRPKIKRDGEASASGPALREIRVLAPDFHYPTHSPDILEDHAVLSPPTCSEISARQLQRCPDTALSHANPPPTLFPGINLSKSRWILSQLEDSSELFGHQRHNGPGKKQQRRASGNTGRFRRGGGERYLFLVDQKHVKYVTVEPGVLPKGDRTFAPVLIPLLAPFPPSDWNVGHVSKDPTSGRPIFSSIVNNDLPGVTNVWHRTRIDLLEFKKVYRVRQNIHKVTHPHPTI